MTRKEILTAIEQNKGKDLILVSEAGHGVVCIERVNKTTILHNAKHIQTVRHSTYKSEGLDDTEDKIVVFDTRKNPPSPQGGKRLLLAA